MSYILQDLREKIDAVDDRLVNLLAERFRLTEQVGIYKLSSKQVILQSGRWEEVLGKLRLLAKKENLSPELLENIWNAIHTESLQQQLKIQEDTMSLTLNLDS